MYDLSELKSLPDAELDQLEHSIQVEKKKRVKAKARELKKQAAELAAQMGITPEELLRGATSTRKTRKVKPKYANPDNQDQTWSGRGNRPGWVTEALDAGKTLEELAV